MIGAGSFVAGVLIIGALSALGSKAHGLGAPFVVAVVCLCVLTGVLVGRPGALLLPAIPLVVLLPWIVVESDYLWPVAVVFWIGAGLVAAVLVGVGILLGRTRPRFWLGATTAIAAITVASTAWLGAKVWSWNQRPREPAAIAAELGAAPPLGVLCGGRIGPEQAHLRPAASHELDVLISEAQVHPDWRVTLTEHDSDSGKLFHEEVTVHELAERELPTMGVHCPARARLEAAL